MEIDKTNITLSHRLNSHGTPFVSGVVRAEVSNPSLADREQATEEFIENFCQKCPLYISGNKFNPNAGVLCSPGQNTGESMEAYMTMNPENIAGITSALCFPPVAFG